MKTDIGPSGIDLLVLLRDKLHSNLSRGLFAVIVDEHYVDCYGWKHVISLYQPPCSWRHALSQPLGQHVVALHKQCLSLGQVLDALETDASELVERERDSDTHGCDVAGLCRMMYMLRIFRLEENKNLCLDCIVEGRGVRSVGCVDHGSDNLGDGRGQQKCHWSCANQSKHECWSREKSQNEQ